MKLNRKPKVLHLKRNSAGWPKQSLKNTIRTGKTQHVSRLLWMALFNAGKEWKIEVFKIARSDIPLQKGSHSIFPRWSHAQWQSRAGVAPPPSTAEAQHHVWQSTMCAMGLKDSTARLGARVSHSALKEKSKFLSIDPEIGSVYPNSVPVLRKNTSFSFDFTTCPFFHMHSKKRKLVGEWMWFCFLSWPLSL